jgi:hypothetical protein
MACRVRTRQDGRRLPGRAETFRWAALGMRMWPEGKNQRLSGRRVS